MVKFLKRCCLVIPIFLVIGLVNYFVDPGNVFHEGKVEGKIARYLAKGENATNVHNLDDRLMRQILLRIEKSPPQVLVLSSSRGEFISNNIFPAKKISNSFVRGATIEDYLALYDMIDSRNWKPEKVVIILDPWLLNDGNKNLRWVTLQKNYVSMLKKLQLPAKDMAKGNNLSAKFKELKAKQLFSFTYFNSAVSYMSEKNTTVLPTNKKLNDGYTYIADGSATYDKKRRILSVADVHDLAVEYINEKPVYSLGQFNTLSPSKRILLEKFVDFLQSKNVSVEFYLPPYHPLVYDYLLKNPVYKEVFEAEKYYSALAKKKNITCRGSYNPAAGGFDESCFYDGMHSKEKVLEKIFSMPAANQSDTKNLVQGQKL